MYTAIGFRRFVAIDRSQKGKYSETITNIFPRPASGLHDTFQMYIFTLPLCVKIRWEIISDHKCKRSIAVAEIEIKSISISKSETVTFGGEKEAAPLFGGSESFPECNGNNGVRKLRSRQRHSYQSTVAGCLLKRRGRGAQKWGLQGPMDT